MTYDPAITSDIPVASARFYQAVYDTAAEIHERYNIGTYREKKLHLILKRYFEPDPAYHEIPCAGFIADILRDGHITEIESNSLTGLHEKLDAYLPEYTVDIVYPLAANRFVTWIDPATGDMSQKDVRRKRQLSTTQSPSVSACAAISESPVCGFLRRFWTLKNTDFSTVGAGIAKGGRTATREFRRSCTESLCWTAPIHTRVLSRRIVPIRVQCANLRLPPGYSGTAREPFCTLWKQSARWKTAANGKESCCSAASNRLPKRKLCYKTLRI